jgi:protein-arginine kinase
LRYAHRLTAGELLGYLTDLRLGASLGLTEVRVEALTALLAEGMPATLTLSAEDPPKRELELDILRARVVKETLFGA